MLQDMSKEFQQFFPFFEKYLLSEDRNEFINSLKPQSKEKKLFSLLNYPLSADYSQKIKKQIQQIGLPVNFLQFLLQQAMVKTISNLDEERWKLMMTIIPMNNQMQFNHQRPLDVGNIADREENENHAPSQLNFFQNIQDLLNSKLDQNKNSFNQFSNFGIKSLSLQRWNNLTEQQKLNLLRKSQIISSYSQKQLAQFIKTIYDQNKSKNITYVLTSCAYKNLTTSQLDCLFQTIPGLNNDVEFIGFWFKHHYELRLKKFGKNQILSFGQKEQKRKLLVQIRAALKKISTIWVQSLDQNTFKELLILDLSLENPNRQLFIEYLQNMKTPCSTLTYKFQQEIRTKNSNQKSNNQQYWKKVHKTYQANTWDQSKMITQYLIGLFKKQNPQQLHKQLSKYIDQTTLTKTNIKVKLNKGQTVQNIYNVLSNKQVNDLKQVKKISILSKNKKHYTVYQQVILTLRVKNVSSIKVKIYQMNLQKNYLENKTKIDQSMKLTYLQPTSSFTYQVQNSNPFKQAIYDLPIKQIQNKRGVYIIDLQGDGITSRAVIRKGAIVCLKKNTCAGIQLKFYDQEGQRIQYLNLWIQDKYVSVQKSYTIPFAKTKKQINVIAIKDNFAELIPVTVQSQEYSWNIGYIYNQQSFIVGNKARIVIHPRLKLHNDNITLKLLKKSKISVEIENNQNIKSYLSFDNIIWSPSQDYILQFPIQSYTKNIIINVRAEIQLQCGDKKKLENQKIIPIDLGQSNNQFTDIYLRKKKDQYFLQIHGQNGQTIPYAHINVTLFTTGINSQIIKTLRSNQQGEIKLGKLSLVKILKAAVQTTTGQVTKSFTINQVQVNYPDRLYYKIGQIVSLPLPTEKSQLKQFVVQKMSQQIILNDLTSAIVIKKNRIQLQGLDQGNYIIRYLPFNININIIILKGKQWEAANQIYDKDNSTVYQIVRSENHLVGLNQARVLDLATQNNIQIDLNLPESGIDQSLRAHVLLSHYIPPNFIGFFNPLQFLQTKNPIQQKFKLKQSQFFNNKRMSDQQCYVENRKNEKKFIGNNLQKPRIFLKRLEIKQTTQHDQQLAAEGAFLAAERASNNVSHDLLFGASNRNLRMACPQIPQNINSHNNFLLLPGISITNLKGKTLAFQAPNQYKYCTVYLISPESAIKKQYSLDQGNEIKKKNLLHKSLQDINQKEGWTMSRQNYKIRKGQQRNVSRNSYWCTVSLSNIVSFAEIKGFKIPDWISQWNSYSFQQKVQSYGKNFCHEINVFIKQNDKQFYEKVVGPHIKNKITKTFVDLCLLEDQSVKEYIQIHKFKQLNQFQKILLVQYLVKYSYINQATAIAKSMELHQKSQKISFQKYKIQFDTVINAKKCDQLNQVKQILNQNVISYDYQPQMQNANIPNNYYNALNAGYSNQAYNFSNQSYQVPHQQMSYGNNAMPPQYGMGQQSYRTSNRGYRGAMQSQSIRPSVSKAKMAYNMEECQQMQCQQQNSIEDQALILRQKFKPGFQPMQKTKQYTETTYFGIKNQRQSKDLVKPSPFWAALATHFIQNSKEDFLSETFMYLQTKTQFILGMCFLPNQLNANFDMKNQGENIVIVAKSSFLIFIKEVRSVQYHKKFGVIINQRFFDPMNPYSYEQDGTQIQKQVDQFLVRKMYSLQTVLTNTSGMTLQLQLLQDIPQGSIPLQSHQYTQITNVGLAPYSTSSYVRSFYFPKEGEYNFYPANACRAKQVIAKAQFIEKIKVKQFATSQKMQSLNDIIRSGNQNNILEFLQTKNIFDTNIFDPSSILWMLKDKKFFQKVLQIFRKRNFYWQQVWLYSIKELFTLKMASELNNQFQIPIYQYFPYYSTRTHKFLNESKSTIRNKQFKKTYFKFLFLSIINNQNSSSFKITMIYYLLLQDRIDQASKAYDSMKQNQRNSHQLQCDYFQCFLDMYQGYPNFLKARKISNYYLQYPIPAWKSLFKEVSDLLKEYDNAVYVQEQAKTQYKTKVINQNTQIRVSMPPQTKVQIHFFPINLEHYFSEYPFSECSTYFSIKPLNNIILEEGVAREERVRRPTDAKDIIVVVYEIKKGSKAKKIESWHWANPQINVNITQKKGIAQVFHKGRQLTGCYCKVYTSNSSGSKFYRDGYTDITGSFKYVLADFEDVKEFKILIMSQFGGVIMTASPPSTAGTIQ